MGVARGGRRSVVDALEVVSEGFDSVGALAGLDGFLVHGHNDSSLGLGNMDSHFFLLTAQHIFSATQEEELGTRDVHSACPHAGGVCEGPH